MCCKWIRRVCTVRTKVGVNWTRRVCTGKPASYVQKKKTIYPDWNSCFDAHLLEGRMVQLIVLQRPDNSHVAETEVTASALADKCQSNNAATAWVRASHPLARLNILVYSLVHLWIVNKWLAACVLVGFETQWTYITADTTFHSSWRSVSCNVSRLKSSDMPSKAKKSILWHEPYNYRGGGYIT